MKHYYKFKLALFLFINMLLLIDTGAQQVTFTNVFDSLGLSHTYTSVMFAGGVSFCDFNRDGLDDLSFTSELGKPLAIFKNNSSGFTNVTGNLNINDTSQARVMLWADYDNDGDKDLFTASFGQQNKLYRNDGGNNFTDVTISAGIPIENSKSSAAAWADIDNDGYLDLYVGNYYYDENPPGNYLFKNNRNGTFTESAFDSGLKDTVGGTNYHKLPLAISCFDYNNDGWTDIYIANDRLRGNTLFRNNGDGNFSDVSIQSHTDIKFDGMGISVADYNNDGYLDLYVSNGPAGNALLKNNGDETFTNIAGELGLKVNKVCWGANFVDVDNDTDLDLFVSVSGGFNGGADPQRQNVLFENLGDGSFVETVNSGVSSDTSISYGNAVGDCNNDGYPDIVVLNNSPTSSTLWQNSGGDNNWIKILLEGQQSNRDGIGSRVEIYIDSIKILRTAACGASYISQNSSSILAGVGNAAVIDSIVVKWPASGIVDVLRNVSVNQTINLAEDGSITSVKQSNDIPAGFVLEQNYPNPFNPATTIKYTIPQSSHVSLKVFDTLGNLIETLVNTEKPAGNYSVQFDAASVSRRISSGVLFYQLRWGNFTQTKKLVFLK